MNEAYVRRQVFRMFRLMGYWPITQTDAAKCPECHALIRPPIGRPDILVLHPRAQTIVVEVKVLRPAETAFSFDDVTPEQHAWLSAWLNHGGNGYLAIGIIRQAKTKHKLEHLYLVDWLAWLGAETIVKPIQNSIPLVAGKGMRKELQANSLDIIHLLQSYELMRHSGGWHLPDGHSAWTDEEGQNRG
jgi:hypothetical protein